MPTSAWLDCDSRLAFARPRQAVCYALNRSPRRVSTAGIVELNELDEFCAGFEVGLADKAGVAMLLAEGRGQRSGNAGFVAPKRAPSSTHKDGDLTSHPRRSALG